MEDHPYCRSKEERKKSSETQGSECFAVRCTSYRNPVTRQQGLSFHRFPNPANGKEEEARYKIWVTNCRRTVKPSRSAVVCSRHFEDKFLDKTGLTVRLRPGAIPTIFSNLPPHLQKSPVKERTTAASKRAMEPLPAPTVDPAPEPSCPLDHTYMVDSPSKIKRKVEELQDRVDSLTKQRRNSCLREKRAKETCKDFIEQLKSAQQINSELEGRLQAFEDIPAERSQQRSTAYTEEQKRFALALNLYSPKEFLRKCLTVPAPRILQRLDIHDSTMTTSGKVIKCLAAVAWEPRKPLSIQEVGVDPPKTHEVRIQVVATSVCHMDWEYLYETGMHFKLFPLVLGHEAAGIVESVGPEVTDFAPGDKVIPLFLPFCRACDLCRSSKTNLCKKNWENTKLGVLADGTSRISCMGQQVYQFLGVSSFCQYTVVPDTSLAKISPDAPLDKVCLLGCGVSTGYGAAINTGKVEQGSSCAVFGLGAVGLAAIMGCKAAMAKTIIGVDINPEKFEKAKLFGATQCINPRDYSQPIQEVLVEMTNGGVDYALECVGSPAVMSAALESTAEAWGTCVIAGWTETETMNIHVIKILKGRILKGTYFGGWKSVEDVPKLVEDYMTKNLKLDEFITHNLPLNQINEAFELLKSGNSIRTVINLQDPQEKDKPKM